MNYKEYTVIVLGNGTIFWFKLGTNIYHREDGPAIEHCNGNKEWLLDNKWHREDGPAIEYANGDKEFYIDGTYYSEEDFPNRNKSPCEGKVVEIDGKKYKLTST
jgi:hypothetical protein